MFLVTTFDNIKPVALPTLSSNTAYWQAVAFCQNEEDLLAVQIIHKNKGSQFDAELAIEFIRMIGIYPPGSVVEMENEEVGIVVANRKDNKLKPVILLVRDCAKHPITPYRQINLSDGASDASGNLYKIAREVPDGTYDIVMSEFVEQGFLGAKPSPGPSPVDDGHGKS